MAGELGRADDNAYLELDSEYRLQVILVATAGYRKTLPT